MVAPSKEEMQKHMQFLPLDPKADYLLVLNAQQISMSDAADLLGMLEKTNRTNTCGAVLVFGDVNTAVKLIDISKLQAQIKLAQKAATKKGTTKDAKTTTKTA